MNKNVISAREKAHFLKFIQNFSPSKALKERWLYFYEKLTPRHWSAIEPWKYWDFEPTNYAQMELTEACFQNIRLHPYIAQYVTKINEVVTVASGHSEPAVYTESKNNFFNGFPENLPLECVVSFVPGRLVMVLNHDGMAMILKR